MTLKRSTIATLPLFWAILTPPISGQSLSVKELAGCYELTVGQWNRPLGGDMRFHSIPSKIRLHTARSIRGGRVVTPDIAYPVGGPMRGYPRWEVLGDTVRIAWSNGFSPTVLRLTKKGKMLTGWAEATSDAIPVGDPHWPRAGILARRVTCAK